MRTGTRAALAISAAIALIAGACANPDPDESTSPDDTDSSAQDTDSSAQDTDDDDDPPPTSDLDVPAGYTHLAAAVDGEYAGETVTVMAQ